MESAIASKLKLLASPGGPAAIAGVAVGAAIVGGLFAVGEGFEKAFNTIRRETGATDAQMKGLEKSFKNVFAGTPGATLTNVADTLSLVHQRTGLTGKALEDLTSKEIELAKITKTDVGANTQATTELFNKFSLSAKDQSGALDVLYKASLTGGKGVATLASEMASTRGVTASLGMSFNQSAAMVALFEKNGLNAGPALMAMNREMIKLGKESGPPSAKSLDSLAKAAAAADSALTKARVSAGHAGDAIALHGQKAQDAANKGLAAASAALDRVNARIDLQRQKALVAHKAFTLSVTDTLALHQAQQRVTDAQAKAATGGGVAGGGSTAAQQRLADATTKAAEAHAKLAAAQHQGAVPASTLQARMKELFDQIKNAPTLVDAMNLAGVTFGARGGKELGIAIRSGALNFQSFANQLGNSRGLIDKTTQATLTLGDKFGLMKNQVLVAIEPIAVGFVKALNFIVDHKPILIGVLGAMGGAFAALGVAATAAAIPIIAAAAPFVAIGAAVAVVVAGVIYAYQHFEIFRNIVNGFVTVLKTVVSFFIHNWKTALEVAFAVVMPFVALPVLILLHWHQIVDFFKALPGKIVSALASLAESLVSSFASAFVGLVAALPNLIGDTVAFFVELPFKIIGLYIDADVWLVETGYKVLSGLITGALKFIPTLWGWLKKLPGLYVQGVIMEVKAEIWLVETGVKILTGLVTGAAAFLPTLLGWLGKLPGLIINAVKSVGGGALHWLEEVGKDVLKGLGQGLVKAAEDTVGHIPFIGGHIVKMFKEALGVKSPSSVFHAIGVNLMEGLTNGILAGSGLPRAAVAGLNLGSPSLNLSGGAIGVGIAGPTGTKLDAIAAHLANMNRHLEARQPLVVHQAIASTEPKKAASESTRLLAAAGYRAGR